MCTPTGAALMTGRYPFRYGLQTAAISSVSAYGLDTTEWLLPQCLKEAAKPLFLEDQFKVVMKNMSGEPVMPTAEGFGDPESP